MKNELETATLAGGCFWCTEAIFNMLRGVKSVLPGYAGGTIKNPFYQQVRLGDTGHAESIQILFDPKQISFEKILDVFWNIHDPTTLNQQGNDVGTQYRSVIFYHNNIQKMVAEKSKAELEKSKRYKDPIVTDYFEKNSQDPYCSFVIGPKIKKVLDKYGNDVKEEYKNPETIL
jgi:peptide-methionine (S)-S-oxide reductase